jgi:hypothetical protein
MKRQELLRQLDQEVESLKRQLGDVSKRLAQFKEEERRPKWAKIKTGSAEYFNPNKWYKIINVLSDNLFYIISETGCMDACRVVGDCHIHGDWELCYDDNPPMEKCSKCGQVIK